MTVPNRSLPLLRISCLEEAEGIYWFWKDLESGEVG